MCLPPMWKEGAGSRPVPPWAGSCAAAGCLRLAGRATGCAFRAAPHSPWECGAGLLCRGCGMRQPRWRWLRCLSAPCRSPSRPLGLVGWARLGLQNARARPTPSSRSNSWRNRRGEHGSASRSFVACVPWAGESGWPLGAFCQRPEARRLRPTTSAGGSHPRRSGARSPPI